MTWSCPACRTTIQHTEDAPRPGTIYRCHICRLELVIDTGLGRLTLAPLPADDHAPASGATPERLRLEAKETSVKPSRLDARGKP
jgi:hypothetical protein